MHAAALKAEIRLFDVQSLKQKRSVLKALANELRQSYAVSVAEVDYQDKWQRSTLGIAVVSAQLGHLERQVHTVTSAIEKYPAVELLEYAVSYLEEPG